MPTPSHVMTNSMGYHQSGAFGFLSYFGKFAKRRRRVTVKHNVFAALPSGFNIDLKMMRNLITTHICTHRSTTRRWTWLQNTL